MQIPNAISIGWAVFAGLTTVTDRPTDGPRYSFCNNRSHLRRPAMRPNNKSRFAEWETIRVMVCGGSTEGQKESAVEKNTCRNDIVWFCTAHRFIILDLCHCYVSLQTLNTTILSITTRLLCSLFYLHACVYILYFCTTYSGLTVCF